MGWSAVNCSAGVFVLHELAPWSYWLSCTCHRCFHRDAKTHEKKDGARLNGDGQLMQEQVANSVCVVLRLFME